MKRYSKSKMDTFYPMAQADLQYDCIVEISDEALVVKYMHEGKLSEYVGVADGPGHYLVSGKGIPATASLHLSEGRILEGSWKEHQQFGMWRIYLEEHE
jgi:hypothetical protein